MSDSAAASSSSSAPEAAPVAPPPLSVTPPGPIDPEAGIKLTLVALEGNKYEVSYDCAAGAHPENGIIYGHSSQFIRDMVGDSPSEGELVELKRVDNDTLELVVKFMKYHAQRPMKEIKRPLELLSMTLDEYLEPFDKEISGVDLGLLLKLTEAANFLNIADLTSLTHAKIISMLKNKKKEEVVELFKPYMHMRQTGVHSSSSSSTSTHSPNRKHVSEEASLPADVPRDVSMDAAADAATSASASVSASA
jgi:hypothetical protein